MRSDASCSILFYLSASEKFAETLGLYNSVVGKPKLLRLTDINHNMISGGHEYEVRCNSPFLFRHSAQI